MIGRGVFQLRPGVNFINVKHANFLYERRFGSFFSSYLYVEKRHLYEKFVRLTLMKLTKETGNEKLLSGKAFLRQNPRRLSLIKIISPLIIGANLTKLFFSFPVHNFPAFAIKLGHFMTDEFHPNVTNTRG